jgi:hypothetical protein
LRAFQQIMTTGVSLTIPKAASTFSGMDARVTGQSLILCAVVALGLAMGGGCESEHTAAMATTQPDLFAASAMDVQPIFTQIAFWTHSPKPDGIEAQLEFTDQFGDPTKASGKVLFELFGYRKDSPDPRGKRLGRWVGSLVTPDEQRERWNTTLRTYRFQLDYPGISTQLSYVLTAIFEPSTGGRFFSQIVLPGQVPEKAAHKSTSPLGGP